MPKLILLILLISSCATSYQKKGDNETGYQDKKVTKNVYNVRYDDEEAKLAENRFMKRCAEITQANDKLYFCSVRVKRGPAGHEIAPGLGFNKDSRDDDEHFVEGNIQLSDDKFKDRECHLAAGVLQFLKDQENK